MVVLSTVPNIAPAASLIIRTIVLARVLGSDKKNCKKKKRIGSINPLSQQQLFCVQETRYTTSLQMTIIVTTKGIMCGCGQLVNKERETEGKECVVVKSVYLVQTKQP